MVRTKKQIELLSGAKRQVLAGVARCETTCCSQNAGAMACVPTQPLRVAYVSSDTAEPIEVCLPPCTVKPCLVLSDQVRLCSGMPRLCMAHDQEVKYCMLHCKANLAGSYLLRKCLDKTAHAQDCIVSAHGTSTLALADASPLLAEDAAHTHSLS